MKKLVLFFLLIAFSTTSFAQEDDVDGASITVTATNVKKSKGKVRFMLYTQNSFVKKEAFETANAKLLEGKYTATFYNLQPGEYAIICYKDTNNNVVLDMNEDGTPKEKVGASNNRSGTRLPSWSDAKFNVGSERMTMELSL